MVLDNRTTAMTGHQGHPGTGVRPDRSQGPSVDIQRLCEGIGVRCTTVDATDYKALEAAIKDEAGLPGLGVIVALAPCALTVRDKPGEVVVDDERCNLCGLCLDVGCPALAPDEVAMRITDACSGCGLCIELCRRGALAYAARMSPGDAAGGRRMSDVTTVSLVGVGGQGILLGAAILAETAAAPGPGREGQRGQGHGAARRQRAQHRAVRARGLVAGRAARGRRHRHRAAGGPPRPRAARRRRHPRLRRHDAHHAGQRAARARSCIRSRRSSKKRRRPAASGSSRSTPRRVAREAGSLRAVNVALLGAASSVLPFSDESWQRGLAAAVPGQDP